jgi:hypothetical protein
MQTPILGSAYVARSVNAADNRMVNLFPEVVPEGGKMPAFLQRCPGLRLQQTIGDGPIRGLWAHQTNGTDFYVVSGGSFYKLNSLTATPTLIGPVSGSGPVSIADNGTQIFIATNTDSYIYNEVTGVYGPITDPDFPGAATVTYLDGYFVFNEPNSQKIWVTQLLDGTSIDPLEFASAEGSPDNVVAVFADHRELWVFGTDTTEVWYNAGLLDFPLVRVQGAFNELGCAAAFSVAKMDNQIYWLGRDQRGGAMVYRAAGYIGQRISTHAVEWQIQQYGDVSDATGYTYQQDGHSFYVLNFPSANATWVFDVATGVWHERASFENGQFSRHRGDNMCNFNGNIVIGDYQNGNIYTFDLTYYSDAGQPQKWLRSWRALPTGQNNLRRTAQHSLQLDCEAGVGVVGQADDIDYLLTEDGGYLITEDGDRITINYNVVQGTDPRVMLRWSDDGGHTWTNENWRSMGRTGRYGQRVIWRRLGMTMKLRDRVYEISGTDPVRVYIMGAELIVSGTAA